MKYLFTFLLMLVCFSGFTQEASPSYSEVVDVAGISRQELYSRAETWLKQLNYQVTFGDPDSGFISVGGEVRVRQPGSKKFRKGRLIYVFTLIIEEQKFWYDFTQYYYDVVPGSDKEIARGEWVAAQPSTPGNGELYDNIDTAIKLKIADLKKSMLAGAQPDLLGSGGLMGNK